MGYDPIDVVIGGRLQLLRKQRKVTLHEVGTAIGTTYQSIRKYESGENRLSASALFRLSRFFDVDFGYFVEGIDQKVDLASKAADSRRSLSRVMP